MTLPSFESVIAAYRNSARRKPNARPYNRRTPQPMVVGQRALAVDALLASATFARPQPKLCDEMPCRIYPTPKRGGALCIRCGRTW